jgi:hypothetical protein
MGISAEPSSLGPPRATAASRRVSEAFGCKAAQADRACSACSFSRAASCGKDGGRYREKGEQLGRGMANGDFG